MNLIHKFFIRHNHPHIIKCVNIATCSTGRGTEAITAWRYDCVLCGQMFLDYTASALELIDTGRKSSVIFRWSFPDKKELE
jgi:hypothetical protein